MLHWEQDEIFPGYWDELMALDPGLVCTRAGVSYEPNEESYSIPVLDRTYRVCPAKKTVSLGRPHTEGDIAPPRISFTEALVQIVYLLKARNLPLAGNRVTEQELPGGALFFRGPHELTRKPVLRRFGQDPDGFLAAGLALGGEKIAFGDAGVRLPALPRVPLEYVLWAADDEFPASLTIIFDPSVTDHLPLDVIWALVAMVTARLAGLPSGAS